MPIECYVVLAQFYPASSTNDVTSNFQGPFALHSVMARALKVSSNCLRLRTPPDSGGSFGIKQGVFTYVVMMGLAARKVGAPVKWVEGRLEHLQGASPGTNRVINIEAAVTKYGRVTALRFDHAGVFLLRRNRYVVVKRRFDFGIVNCAKHGAFGQ